MSIEYSISLEKMDEWEGPFSDPKDIIKITNRLMRKGLMKSRLWRVITGVYGTTDIPCPHFKFPSYKSWCDNVSEWVGQSQCYGNCKNTLVAILKTSDVGATVWFIMESDYNLNRENNWGEEE
tara:strand:+ start:1950 stop:2318 length:369 start_codon:yes stop_codon:yes gene_type:complete